MEVGESYPDETVEKEADISIHEEKEKKKKTIHNKDTSQGRGSTIALEEEWVPPIHPTWMGDTDELAEADPPHEAMPRAM